MTDGVGNVADPAAVELPAGRAYLSLGEVLDVLKEQFADVTISKIRFFEAQGLLVPERTPSGYRKFFPADIERLRVILADQEQRYVPLAAARAVVSQATAEPVSPVGPVPATGTGSSASAAADTTLSRDTPAAMGASAAFGEHPAGSGDAGEVELEENYDGVDLGSDRHPALRGRREAGPPTPSRRPRPEPNRPPAGQPASATNVAPLRRVAATASAGVQSAAPSSGTASGDVGPDLAHGEWVAEAASYSRAEVLAATGASEALFDDAVKQGFLRGRSVLGVIEFDNDDRRLLESLVTLGGSGLDPRHVRVFMHAAQREADLYVQATLPLLRRRPQLGVSIEEPFRRFGDLEAAGATLRGVVVRRALRAALDGAPGPTSPGG